MIEEIVSSFQLAELERLGYVVVPAERVVPEHVAERAPRTALLMALKAVTGFSPEQVRSAWRGRKIWHARQLGYYFAVEHLGWSTTKTGLAMCKNHTTVMAGAARMRKRLDGPDAVGVREELSRLQAAYDDLKGRALAAGRVMTA